MRKKVMSLAIFCLVSLSIPAIAQTATTTTSTTEPTAPTEVGTTTMPAGQYIMREVNTGKQYTLTVTDKGNMIFGPVNAPATAAAPGAAKPTAAAGLKGLAEKEMGQGMGSLIEKQGMSEMKNFIK